MYIQYRGGGVLSIMGVFSTVGGYHDACGDILSTVEDIVINKGYILSTVGGVQYHGGYHDACGRIL